MLASVSYNASFRNKAVHATPPFVVLGQESGQFPLNSLKAVMRSQDGSKTARTFSDLERSIFLVIG
jgi:hypothetical protein